MKYCPVCQTRYDEEIMRFCTKDGTPLIDEEAPNFIEMPSENLETSEEDDFGAETVIRRNPPEKAITNVEPRAGETSQRMVIPTSEPPPEKRLEQTASYQQPPPKRTSTAAVVLLTILGTIVVLGGGLGIYWLMSGGQRSEVANSNSNLNTNQDTNLNTDLGIDNSLFNVNGDTNANTNVNGDANANTSPSPSPSKTPTPSPTRTPTPSPTPDEDDDNANTDDSNSGAPVNTRPPASPTPRPSPAAPPANSPVNVGNMNTRAVSLAKPVYPPLARQIRVGGQVPVQITVDESGQVISAKATNGHPLLRQAAESAARSSRFTPLRVSGKAVKSTGTVVYNFVGN